jgi:hypothetical protein
VVCDDDALCALTLDVILNVHSYEARKITDAQWIERSHIARRKDESAWLITHIVHIK